MQKKIKHVIYYRKRVNVSIKTISLTEIVHRMKQLNSLSKKLMYIKKKHRDSLCGIYSIKFSLIAYIHCKKYI